MRRDPRTEIVTNVLRPLPTSVRVVSSAVLNWPELMYDAALAPLRPLLTQPYAGMSNNDAQKPRPQPSTSDGLQLRRGPSETGQI